MNFNITGYAIYFAITAFIILRVGWLFYHYGAIYLHDIFPHRNALAQALNRLLLICYYLFNLGYAAISINDWPAIENYPTLFGLLANKLGFICMLLGVMHFLNMAWVKLLRNTIIHLYKH